MSEEKHHRRIKSYVLRQGRMTFAQEHALNTAWDKWGLGKPLFEGTEQNPDVEFLQVEKVFGNRNELVVEIGFGMGDSLIAMAQQRPNTNFIGIEVHTPGIGNILQRIEEFKLSNIRVFHADALNILNLFLAPESLSAVYLYFPDPWQKRRHNKRRIVKTEFIHLIYSRLKNEGVFHMATDWQDYAIHMLQEMKETIENSQNREQPLYFINQADDNAYIERPDWRPLTKFEQKGLNKGHQIWDLLFKKTLK
ncbi:MAG: tRNA (guanosine(46)-N7)-methyltransferase TrmB [Gammaproteobacteria bacterium]|nr:tRNA (guanosine(46)-N7)-methyltransferase TrmB [Gammaproteobacteria bacterium]